MRSTYRIAARAALLCCLGLGCGRAGSACHNTADCAAGLSCAGPNDPHRCGIPPREECAASSDCTGGNLCQATADGCSEDGVGSQCGAPCAASCQAGFRCSAGACEALPCDEGYACPAHQRCDPAAARSGPIHARAHGCVNIPCTADSGCAPGRSCVNGFCQTGIGSCAQSIAVP